jgi:F420-dependent oxidoreductase-like protein
MRKLGLYLGRLPGFDKAGFDLKELTRCVQAAESCGYDSFWMPESWERESFSVLAHLAASTERISLATGIINVFSRSPALVAMSAATIDEISNGRFRLGLGTSGSRVIEDFHGIKYHKPLTRLKETIEIIRLLLAGEPVDFEGECFGLKRFRLGFKPMRTYIPIFVAALAPKSLHQIGEMGDGWIPVHWPRTLLSEGITEIQSGARSVNRDSSQIEIAPFVNVIVSDDIRRARDHARLPIAYYVGGMGDYYHASLARLGFAKEADAVRSLWQEGRSKSAIRAVTDEMVDAIAICGSLQHCRENLNEIYNQGATLPVVSIPREGTLQEKIRFIESLAS